MSGQVVKRADGKFVSEGFRAEDTKRLGDDKVVTVAALRAATKEGDAAVEVIHKNCPVILSRTLIGKVEGRNKFNNDCQAMQSEWFQIGALEAYRLILTIPEGRHIYSISLMCPDEQGALEYYLLKENMAYVANQAQTERTIKVMWIHSSV